MAGVIVDLLEVIRVNLKFCNLFLIFCFGFDSNYGLTLFSHLNSKTISNFYLNIIFSLLKLIYS